MGAGGFLFAPLSGSAFGLCCGDAFVLIDLLRFWNAHLCGYKPTRLMERRLYKKTRLRLLCFLLGLLHFLLGRMKPQLGLLCSLLGQNTPHLGRLCFLLGQMKPQLGRLCFLLGQISPQLGRLCSLLGQISPQLGHLRFLLG